jgi:signal transduction histidine kinase
LLARLAQAIDTQRAFVADAAHALRTPLAALQLQAQLVERAGSPEARQEAVGQLRRGLERLTHLVAQLLTLARQEPGAAPPASAPVALAPLLRQVLADSAPLAQARGSTLALQVDSQAEGATVRGDAAALSVLARNLVDNALRYTPPGGQVQAGIELRQGAVLLQVDDNGPGIPVAERERVFERFVRGSTGAQDSGSGLGLAIVRSIAQRHGATLALQDSPLGGLRVALQFPAA